MGGIKMDLEPWLAYLAIAIDVGGQASGAVGRHSRSTSSSAQCAVRIRNESVPSRRSPLGGSRRHQAVSGFPKRSPQLHRSNRTAEQRSEFSGRRDTGITAASELMTLCFCRDI
jgi:hypothetical protein